MGYKHLPNLRVAENELSFQELCRKCYKEECKVHARRKEQGEGKLQIRKGNRLGDSKEKERQHVGKEQITSQLL